MPEEEMTERPTIDPDSPKADQKERQRKFMKLLSKYSRLQYRKMYYAMKKFRDRQRVLLETDDIEDPDPFVPTYIFYCFTGKLED